MFNNFFITSTSRMKYYEHTVHNALHGKLYNNNKESEWNREQWMLKGLKELIIIINNVFVPLWQFTQQLKLDFGRPSKIIGIRLYWLANWLRTIRFNIQSKRFIQSYQTILPHWIGDSSEIFINTNCVVSKQFLFHQLRCSV